MKTENLIDSLAGDFEVKRPLPSRGQAMFLNCATAIALAMIVFAFFHHRGDLHEVMGTGQFVLGALALLFSWGFLNFALVQLASPGTNARAPLIAGGGALLLFVVGFLTRSIDLGAAEVLNGLSVDKGYHCALSSAFLALLPAVFLVSRLRRGAPAHPALVGLGVGVAGSALGATILQFSCNWDNPGHVLVWHALLPMIAMAVVFAWVGSRLLRW